MAKSKAAMVVTGSSMIILLLSVSAFASELEELEGSDDYSYAMPQNWGQLRPEWATCGLGQMQSPINIMTQWALPLPNLGPLSRFYWPSPALLKNRGHDIMLHWPGGQGGVLWIDGVQYNFKQLHWHSPSEHTFNGLRYSLEMHMVHESFDKRLAVVAILYNVIAGQPDPFIAMLEPQIRAIAGTKGAEIALGAVDATPAAVAGNSFYRYAGSLTTPPCTEGVSWTLLNHLRTVSWEQLQLIKGAIHDVTGTNARLIQPTNGRLVGFFGSPYGDGSVGTAAAAS